jgi:UDP-glucuronate 4-epimerase
MADKKLRILVTGCAGFIGSNLCDQLLKEGHFVLGIDHLSDYYDPIIKINNISHNFNNPNFKFLVKNIQEKQKLDIIMQEYEIDVIIHLAARAGVRASIDEPLKFKDTNITGTVNLLELARQHNVKQFIFASSSSVYGNNKKVPFSEEDHVEEPISPYATSKRACESYCYTYNHLFKLPTIVLRFFNVYGPRNRPDMAHYKFTKAILEEKAIPKYGDGTTSRDYTYVDDIVEGIISSLDKDFNFEIFNLGNSTPITLNEMISTLEKVLDKKAIINQKPMPQGDVTQTYADNSKAKKLLNWEPKTPYKEGVRKMVEWYKNK